MFIMPDMKTKNGGILVGLVCCIVLVASIQTYAESGLALGGRYHQDHGTFTELPYSQGDLSYGVMYEIFEKGASVLQLGCSMTPEFDNAPDLDYALTPEMNLMMRDGIFQGGFGLMSSYLSKLDGDSEWMDLYYQFLLGLRFDLSKKVSFQINASYVYAEWDEIFDFDFSDVEGTAYIGYSF